MNFGDPIFPERFWEKLIPEPNTGCWLWLAGTTDGRASYWDGSRFVRPHRMTYSAVIRELPANRRLNSSCDTEHCCNPSHFYDAPPQTKEERLAYKREWRREAEATRPEFKKRRRADARARYAANPEAGRETSLRWRREHSEHLRDYAKEWRDRNPDRIKRQSHVNRLRRYGLTAEVFEQMIADQGSKCAICSTKISRESGIGNALHIDHCHRTGRVRGLLCGKCNLGIGMFGDDPERLEAAIRYLKKGG